MIRRLRIQFIVIVMCIVTVMLGLITVTVLYLTRASLERESLGMMQQVALNPLRAERPNEEFSGVRLPYFSLELLADGRAVPARGSYYDLSDEAFLQEAVDQVCAAGAEYGILQEYGLRYLLVATGNTAYLVFADISNETSLLTHLAWTCLAIDAAAFLVFLVVSILLAFWVAAPIDAAWKQQRQFVADASHELKTPLTVILTNAELLQNDYPAEESRRFAANILTMSRQMRTLIESLLTLARVDQGLPRQAAGRVDWSQTAADALLPFEPVFFERGLQLEADITPGLAARGDAGRLRQVVEILLDNAQKYAAPGSTVTLRLGRQGAHSLLTVTSRGEPISASDLKNIFKRFYRADAARRRDGSYGLGLSIAQNIVRQHRGRIWAESENGRNTFSVRLPLGRGPLPTL